MHPGLQHKVCLTWHGPRQLGSSEGAQFHSSLLPGADEPLRNRRLLLHKREIRNLDMKMKKEGYTVVPTKIYFTHGKAKLEIALAKGKKLYDKREAMKERDIRRDLDKGN